MEVKQIKYVHCAAHIGDGSTHGGSLPLLKAGMGRVSGWIGTDLKQPPALSYRELKTWRASMIQADPENRQGQARKVIYMIWNL
jgi:hypothetical protein